MSRRVLERLLRAMAVGSVVVPGCTDRAVTIDDGDEGPQPAPSSSGDEGADAAGVEAGGLASTGGGPGEAEAEAEVDGGDDGMIFDIGGSPGDVFVPPPPLDPSLCADPVGNPAFACEFDPEPDAPLYYFCVESTPGVLCDDYGWDAEYKANECIGSTCTSDVGLWATGCGADPTVTDACCYWLVYLDSGWCLPPEGRPFVIDGAARLADTASRGDWLEPAAPDLQGLTSAQREGLATMWTEHARFEHASIASFARFVLQLLSVGAPAALVHDAQRAMADEIRHATATFGLASAYAGRPIGPGVLDVGGSLDTIAGLEAIVVATVDEGCIAETISAWQALEAARDATDPAVTAVLHAIAEEELRHAELAWRFVRWALSVGSTGLRRSVAAAFADAAHKVPRGSQPPPGLDEPTMQHHGVLTPARRAATARIALQEIIAPAAAALLDAPSMPREPCRVAPG
jgi:hypothetical protein